MTTLREAAQQALEALESTQLYCAHEHYPRRRVADAITALRAALEHAVSDERFAALVAEQERNHD